MKLKINQENPMLKTIIKYGLIIGGPVALRPLILNDYTYFASCVVYGTVIGVMWQLTLKHD